jgi:hypothetical protein
LFSSNAAVETAPLASRFRRISATPPEAGANPDAVEVFTIGFAKSLVDLPYACTPELVSAMPLSVRNTLLPLHCQVAPSGHDIVTTVEAGKADGNGTEEVGVPPVPPDPVSPLPEPEDEPPPVGVVPPPAGVVPVPPDDPAGAFEELSATELPPPPPQAPRTPAAMRAARTGFRVARVVIMYLSPAGKLLRRSAQAGKRVW